MVFSLPFLIAGVFVGALWASDVELSGQPPLGQDARVAMAEPVTAPAGGDEASSADGLGSYLRGAVSDLGGNPESASRDYTAALAEDPDNIALRKRVFELALMGGDTETALRLAKSLPEVDQNVMTRLALAVDFAHDGKIKDARKQLRMAAKAAPNLLHFEIFMAYLDFADGAKAEKLVRRLGQLPLSPAMEGRRQYHIGRLWLKAGEPDKALLALERAHAVEPSAIFTVLLLGETYLRQGAPDKAEKLYADFAAQNPAVSLLLPDRNGMPSADEKHPPFASTLDEDMASALFDFSLLVWGEGALGPSRQLMNLALQADPGQPYFTYYSGVLMEMGRDFPAASKRYAALVSDPVLGVGAQLRLAEIEFKQGDQNVGWKKVLALLKAYPDSVVIHRSVAQLAFERKDFARASREYTWLLDQVKGTSVSVRVPLLFARGAAYERGGSYTAAEKDFREALELEPANAEVMNYLGYMWIENGHNNAEALNLIKKAHLLAPQDSAVTDSLGWAYYKNGDYEAAQRYLEVAVVQDPESVEIMDHLGDVYLKLDQPGEAVKQWQRALELVGRGADEPRLGFTSDLERKIKKAE